MTSSCQSENGGTLNFYAALRGPPTGLVGTASQTADAALPSCKAIGEVLPAVHSKYSGMYWINPSGGAASNAFQVYCDFGTDSSNGGWTIIFAANGDANKVCSSAFVLTYELYVYKV